MAIRVQGSRLWLLIDDRPVASVTDATFLEGGAVIRLLKLAGRDDTQETTVVIRNLRVSSLVDSEAPALTHDTTQH
jgi:hypothetical protein